VEEIEDWVGQDVFDSGGERVGKLQEVFYLTRTGEATFATLKSGLLGRHARVVPLAGASVGRDYVRLAYTGEQIESAGGEDAPETLGSEDALRIGGAYGVQIAPEDEFESAQVVRERIRASEEAHRRAEELAAEADRQAAEAQEARAASTDASREAQEKQERSERARAEADRARAEADRLAGP